MSDDKLKPCPFCEGTDIRIDAHPHAGRNGETVYSMCCYQCGATFPNRYKRQLLVDAWNRRALPAPSEWREAIEAAAKVVQSAREGEMDTDLRSIIWAIRALSPPGKEKEGDAA